MTLETYIVVPDIHVPFHDRAYIRIVNALIELVKPDGIVQLGDAVDWHQISKHDKDPGRILKLEEEAEQYGDVAEKWMSLMDKNDKGSYFIQLEGNHEDRLRRYIWQRAPELSEIIPSFEDLFDLHTRASDYNIKVEYHSYSKWNSCQIGNTILHHGHYFNQHVAAKNLDIYCMSNNFITGHTHRYQQVSNGRYWSCSLGHGAYEESVAHNPAPPGWQQVIGILTTSSFADTLEPVFVNNGKTIFRGHIIEG